MLVSASLCLAALGACVDADVDSPDDDTEAADLSRPPPPPAYTTVTLFSEAGLWGTSQTMKIYRNDAPATPSDPAPGPVSQHFTVDAALANSVSSARITCGTSATDLLFFDRDAPAGAAAAAVTCRPGATVEVNFHTTRGYPGGAFLGDRIDALTTWARPDVINDYPLSQAIHGIWNDVHSQIVPSTDWYAPRAKEMSLYIYDSNWFMLTQEYDTWNETAEAPIWIQIYGHVVNDANGFHFQTELHYFGCTRATGTSSGISCGAHVDQERNALVATFRARLDALANALPHTRNAYIYPTLGALEFGVGFVP